MTDGNEAYPGDHFITYTNIKSLWRIHETNRISYVPYLSNPYLLHSCPRTILDLSCPLMLQNFFSRRVHLLNWHSLPTSTISSNGSRPRVSCLLWNRNTKLKKKKNLKLACKRIIACEKITDVIFNCIENLWAGKYTQAVKGTVGWQLWKGWF